MEESARRTRADPEFELLDTGVFDDDRYFDVFVEYAKGSVEDIAIRITVENRGPEAAEIDLLPTIWFRNRWSWRPGFKKPSLSRGDAHDGVETIVVDQEESGRRYLYCDGSPELLFTNNETNTERLFKTPNATPYVKDGIHEYVVHGNAAAVNPAGTGTKCAARYRATIPGGGRQVFHLRLTDALIAAPFAHPFAVVFDDRIAEADEFYKGVIPDTLSDDGKRVMRQAFAGLLWGKQYYHYVVRDWLNGDPGQPVRRTNAARDGTTTGASCTTPT